VTAASPQDRSPTGGRGADVAPGGPRLPRWLLVLGVPLAGIVLVVLFVFLQFPFERFRDGVARQAGTALGAQVVIGELAPTWTVGGPGFVARDVQIRWPDGARAQVEEARVRPAWSPSWMTGAPALHVDARSDVGAVRGTVTVGEEPAFDGRLEGVDLDRLPIERFARGAALDGILDLDADLVLRAAGPVGTARFDARDGSLAARQLPIAVPYTALRGHVELPGDGSLALDGVALEGPMISATVEGGTRPGPSLWLAPLELDVHLEVSDRNLRPTVRSAGVRLGPDGSADLKVRGNLAAPVVR
jgi:type II secretion system protein N